MTGSLLVGSALLQLLCCRGCLWVSKPKGHMERCCPHCCKSQHAENRTKNDLVKQGVPLNLNNWMVQGCHSMALIPEVMSSSLRLFEHWPVSWEASHWFLASCWKQAELEMESFMKFYQTNYSQVNHVLSFCLLLKKKKKTFMLEKWAHFDFHILHA